MCSNVDVKAGDARVLLKTQNLISNRPRKTWSESVKIDVSNCVLAGIDPQDRDEWRAGVPHDDSLVLPAK